LVSFAREYITASQAVKCRDMLRAYFFPAASPADGIIELNQTSRLNFVGCNDAQPALLFKKAPFDKDVHDFQ
jgi:hypothetical protein